MTEPTRIMRVSAEFPQWYDGYAVPACAFIARLGCTGLAMWLLTKIAARAVTFDIHWKS